MLGYQKFIGEDDFSADYIDEGKALMKRGEDRIQQSVASFPGSLLPPFCEERPWERD